MKKRLFVLFAALIVLLLLCCSGAGAEDEEHTCYYVYHPVDAWSCEGVCPKCGAYGGVTGHAAFCYQNTSVCFTCGMGSLYYDNNPLVMNKYTETIFIYHDWYIANLGQEHSYFCMDCGLEHVEQHAVNCTSPNVCNTCRLAVLNFPVEKMSHNNKMINLGSEHVWQCEECGYQSGRARHWARCDENTSVCKECGATGLYLSGQELVHSQPEYVSVGAMHQLVCRTCGYKGAAEPHLADCTDKSTCFLCGAKNLSLSADYISHEWQYTNLGAQHQRKCTRCGEMSSPEPHWAFCYDRMNCAECGVGGLNLAEGDPNIYHDGESIDLGSQHQYVCKWCDYQDEPANHWAYCDKPGVCAGCGRATTIAESEIYHDDYLVILGEMHQPQCRRCDYKGLIDYHSVVCGERNVCYYCGAAVESIVDDDHLLHYLADIKWDIAETTHQEHCVACGYRWDVEEHRVICTADTVCADCGKTGLHVPENDLYHPSPVKNIEGSASGHSFDCDACGRHISNRAHTFVDGKCRTCGWEESTLPVTLPGDASGDGKTDIFDALAILQYAVGWDTDLNPDAGDVNDDGKCDIFDALLILQYSVGWDVELK